MADERADLFAAAAFATLAAAIVLLDVLPGGLTTLAGLPLVLFLPGYALSRALFGEIRGGAAETTVLSLALSVALLIAVGLLVNLSPLSLSAESWSILLLGVTLAACAVALRRQPERRSWTPGARAPRAGDVALLAAAALVAAGAIAVARTPMAAPDEVRGYTELSQVRRGKAVVLKVTANELAPARYRVELRADGRLLRRWRTGALEAGRRWSARLPVSSARRARTLEARLFRRASAKPYRRVRLELRPWTR